MTNVPIWQVAILLTLVFVVISFWLQIISKRSYILDTKRFNALIERNDKLVLNIQRLQVEIAQLNTELELLTMENRNLNVEIGLLTAKVTRLQTQVEVME